MNPVKKILVAIKDIDAKSMPAVRKAAQLAKANGATLELFHALSDTVLVEALDARRISLKDYEAQRLGLVLKRLQGRRFVEFQDLFDPVRGVPLLVVTFIATLELSREHLIEVTQAEAFAPIYVRLAYEPS